MLWCCPLPRITFPLLSVTLLSGLGMMMSLPAEFPPQQRACGDEACVCLCAWEWERGCDVQSDQMRLHREAGRAEQNHEKRGTVFHWFSLQGLTVWVSVKCYNILLHMHTHIHTQHTITPLIYGYVRHFSSQNGSNDIWTVDCTWEMKRVGEKIFLIRYYMRELQLYCMLFHNSVGR